ncbi:transcription initiation factor IIF subunit beta-like [Zingiber officinale]|uniref:transcription initiation factor IIF subunit beta-like n=1 Tax=Zingiber officinale TaxID=94328 RepID=UPI001C4BF2B3|nr:transcription initiation factor IIF subunit beta-like [Zingiber officinale]
MEDDGGIPLDTARAERPVWLLKCPPAASRALQSAASGSVSSTSPNPVVAKIVHTIDLFNLDDPSSEQFNLEMVPNDSGNAPRSYKLNASKDFVPMSTFSESNQGKLSVEGKVKYKFDMEPQNFRDYSKICRERTNKSMIKTRKVQVIDNDHGGLMRPMPGMVGLVSSGSKDKKKVTPSKGSDAKRTRRDKGEMLNILFKLFERQPNWALKQLVQETDQPEQFLKEILNEICVYNKRGPNQGTHELKAEYKNFGGTNNE